MFLNFNTFTYQWTLFTKIVFLVQRRRFPYGHLGVSRTRADATALVSLFVLDAYCDLKTFS